MRGKYHIYIAQTGCGRPRPRAAETWDPGRQEEKLRWCGRRKEELGGGGGVPLPAKEGQLAGKSIQVEGLVIPGR